MAFEDQPHRPRVVLEEDKQSPELVAMGAVDASRGRDYHELRAVQLLDRRWQPIAGAGTQRAEDFERRHRAGAARVRLGGMVKSGTAACMAELRDGRSPHGYHGRAAREPPDQTCDRAPYDRDAWLADCLRLPSTGARLAQFDGAAEITTGRGAVGLAPLSVSGLQPGSLAA